MKRSGNEWGYSKSVPLQVDNGLKIRTPGADSSWWARRWIQALEGFGWSNRLGRGRSYARRGQVIDFSLSPGRAVGQVQGSRPRPYSVTLSLSAFTTTEWQTLYEAMAGEAAFAAGLLSGEMPQDVDQVFASAGLSLFPARESDLKTSCSCPDVANPCKHVAALHYVLAAEFDKDPFLLFTLRGQTREAVLSGVRGARREPAQAEEAAAAAPLRCAPLSVADFWKSPELSDIVVTPAPPREDAEWLRRLGDPPFWQGDSPLHVVLRPVYQAATRTAMGWASGEPLVAPEDETRAVGGRARTRRKA